MTRNAKQTSLPEKRRMALAKLLERNLPAKPDPKGETVVPDSALTAAISALKE